MKKVLFRIFIIFYKIIPCKRLFCKTIKPIKILNKTYYKKLKFRGRFKVNFSSNYTFLMFHYGANIENEIFWKGLFVTWESDTGWIWQELCKFSDVVFDIGANTGVYSLVAKSLNPNADVYAFEPSKHTYHKLKKNNTINNFNIICEDIALSDKNGEQIFYDVDYEHQSSASLSPKMLMSNKNFTGEIIEYKVRTMTLSHYIESNSIKKIDLIKLDIEMHEPEAINGLGEYLLRFKPIIILEVLNAEVANKLNKLIDFNYFKIFHLQKALKSKQLDEFKLCEGGMYLLFHNDLNDKIKLYTSLYG